MLFKKVSTSTYAYSLRKHKVDSIIFIIRRESDLRITERIHIVDSFIFIIRREVFLCELHIVDSGVILLLTIKFCWR